MLGHTAYGFIIRSSMDAGFLGNGFLGTLLAGSPESDLGARLATAKKNRPHKIDRAPATLGLVLYIGRC